MRPNLEKRMTPEIGRALEFTKLAHLTDKRRYTGVPYWTHAADVADTVASVTRDPEVIMAALLHDTVEDTVVTPADIEREFGRRVAALVAEVTNLARPDDGKRAARAEINRAHLANSSADGATIKLADLIDNTKSIREYDPKFAKTYLKEKRDLLEVLKHGDPTLWAVASGLAKEG